MGKPSLTAATADHFRERLAKLEPDSERRFGTLDPAAMLRHMRLACEVGAGEVEVEDESTPVVRSVMFFVITRIMTTWPGGRIKAPDFWTPPADHEFEEERTALLAAMDRFNEKLEKEPDSRAANPVLGSLSTRQWSRLTGIHFHHHLRQFGV